MAVAALAAATPLRPVVTATSTTSPEQTPEPVQLYGLIVRVLREHAVDDDAGQLMCTRCQGHWPCHQARLAYRLREGF